jgi:hypothetical protein
MRGTWQTEDSGSGAGTAILVVLAVALLAGPVLAAAAALVDALIMAALVVLAVLVVAAVGVVVFRVRRRRAVAAAGGRPWLAVGDPVAPLPGAAQDRTGPRALPPRQELHVHHHWHGVSAEQVAEVIRQEWKP